MISARQDKGLHDLASVQAYSLARGYRRCLLSENHIVETVLSRWKADP